MRTCTNLFRRFLRASCGRSRPRSHLALIWCALTLAEPSLSSCTALKIGVQQMTTTPPMSAFHQFHTNPGRVTWMASHPYFPEYPVFLQTRCFLIQRTARADAPGAISLVLLTWSPSPRRLAPPVPKKLRAFVACEPPSRGAAHQPLQLPSLLPRPTRPHASLAGCRGKLPLLPVSKARSFRMNPADSAAYSPTAGASRRLLKLTSQIESMNNLLVHQHSIPTCPIRATSPPIVVTIHSIAVPCSVTYADTAHHAVISPEQWSTGECHPSVC